VQVRGKFEQEPPARCTTIRHAFVGDRANDTIHRHYWQHHPQRTRMQI
jgi:hypothetical protein